MQNSTTFAKYYSLEKKKSLNFLILQNWGGKKRKKKLCIGDEENN
jgi:hypothetical protein